MASVCFCIIAAAVVSLGFTQSYGENDIMYSSKFDSWKMDGDRNKVNISVDLRTAVQEVDRRFVSIALDSNLVDVHWRHFDFRYDIFILHFCCC